MGPWAIAALVAIAAATTDTGKTVLRRALKYGIKAGYKAKDAAAEIAAKANEYKKDVVAEIEAEREDLAKKKQHAEAES